MNESVLVNLDLGDGNDILVLLYITYLPVPRFYQRSSLLGVVESNIDGVASY